MVLSIEPEIRRRGVGVPDMHCLSLGLNDVENTDFRAPERFGVFGPSMSKDEKHKGDIVIAWAGCFYDTRCFGILATPFGMELMFHF